jgi:catechol 2,3-dioxygenase-like lactoylglutathione lyase family enzyme
MITADHIGIVVADLERSEATWCDLLGATVLFRQPPTQVDASAFGLPSDATVRVVMLRFAESHLELMEFLAPSDGARTERQTHDAGMSHVAFWVERDRFEATRTAWSSHVRWYSEVQRVAEGPAAGIMWCYGMSDDGVLVELTWRPPVAETA